MEEKEFDLFINMMRRPDSSVDKLVAGGLNSENTQLLSRNEYENSDKVRDQFKDENGNFDKFKFDNFYNNAKVVYNYIANADYEQSMLNQITFHRDNIFVPEQNRSEGPNFIEIKTLNPEKRTKGIFEIGKIGERTQSIDELMQANKVLLNPTTAGDNLENAQWGESPNNSFFTYLDDVLIQAQYDTDGFHKDHFTGKIVEHKAGDFKLDEDGNYFYEKLDGRDIYGKRVLNKMNTLTTDGSWLNQFDFFDSDDLQQKSIGGTVLKNLALVGSMFIPGNVGLVITGLNVVTQLAGMGSTLLKMLNGSDSPKLSFVEGWVDSVSIDNLKTEYAQNNVWCWENMVDLVGTVASQIKGQRFIFEKIPHVLSGTNIYSKTGQANKLKFFEENRKKLANAEIKKLKESNMSLTDILKAEANIIANTSFQAQKDLNSFIKGYQKIGSILSKGYMTALVVSDTYGEAKLAGASDEEAMWLTLGYAAMEYALLSSRIGSWMMPELRGSKIHAEAITKALIKNRELGFKTPNESKISFAKRLFESGKNLSKQGSLGLHTAQATIGAGLNESIEEVSEELLADFSKACFNWINSSRNDNTRLNSFGYNYKTNSWNKKELIDRYSMSFIGGFIGGGFANAGINYETLKSYEGLSQEQAIRELTYMHRNGELQKFLKNINKLTIAPKTLSAVNYTIENNEIIWSQGTKDDNQDLYAKKLINNIVSNIQSILDANGGDLSDQHFLNRQTLGDIRFSKLLTTTTAGRFVSEYNELGANLVQKISALDNLLKSRKDNDKNGVVTDSENRKNQVSTISEDDISKLKQEIQDIQKQITDLVEGKRSEEFIQDSLFEMLPIFNESYVASIFPIYAERFSGKKLQDLSQDEIEQLKKQYEVWKTTEGRDKIHQMSSLYRFISEKSSTVLQKFGEKYNRENIQKEVKELNELASNIYSILSKDEDDFLEKMQNKTSNSFTDISRKLVELYGDKALTTELEQLQKEFDDLYNESEKETDLNIKQLLDSKKQELEVKASGLINNSVLDILNTKLDDIIENSYITEELRNKLEEIYQNLTLYFDETIDMDSLFQQNNDVFEKLEYIRQKLDLLKETPIEKNLGEFLVALGQNTLDLQTLIKTINERLYSFKQDITSFTLDNQLLEGLKNAIGILNIYKASILGARTDSVNYVDIYGYNKVINEISKSKKLAEIDSETADNIVIEINQYLNKLNAIKQLFEINTGSKLLKQENIQINKNILIYKRFKPIISIDDDDPLSKWEGFDELKSKILSMTLHEKLFKENHTNLTKEERIEFEKEFINLETAIYEFFNKNIDNIKNGKLSEFINFKRFNLYNNTNNLLTESSTSFDDVTFLYWIAARIAINANDFYSKLNKILQEDDNKLAILPSQELAVYLNYASIMNGDIISQFQETIQSEAINHWLGLEIDERKEVLKNLNLPEQLSSKDFEKYLLHILPVAKYSNIVLTEGIAGSGKTSAVISLTYKLLQETNKDLANSALFVHGVDSEHIQDFVKKLNQDVELKISNREQLMKAINSSWKDLEKNPLTGEVILDKNDIIIENNNLSIKFNINDKNESKIPSFIVIDEITKFSVFDLDQINAFAKKYGITVIALGDYDQTTLSGKFKLEETDATINIKGLYSYFIRTPKLGQSMRTDNYLKTLNNHALQQLQHSDNKNVVLNYYESENNIYGDVVYIGNVDINRIIQKIHLFIENLKRSGSNEKIGFIYDSPDSQLFKILSQDKYSSYIDIKEGGSAQGLEARYYIMDLKGTGDFDTDLKNLYTGATRAKQASLIYLPNGFNNISINNNIHNENIKEPSTEIAIKQHNQKIIEIRSSILNVEQGITFKPRVKKSIVQRPSKTGPDKQGGVEITYPIVPYTKPLEIIPVGKQEPSDVEKSSEQYIEIKSDNSLLQNNNENADQSEQNSSDTETNQHQESDNKNNQVEFEQETRFIANNDGYTVLIDTQQGLTNEPSLQNENLKSIQNDDADKEPTSNVQTVGNTRKISMLLHSHDSFETGLPIDYESEKTKIVSDFYKDNDNRGRIDSINGLYKFYISRYLKEDHRKPSTVEEYVKIIGILRDIIFNSNDKLKIIDQLKTKLGINTDKINIQFAFKSSFEYTRGEDNNQQYVSTNTTDFFEKGYGEQVLFNPVSKKPYLKHIVAIINIDGINMIELPLLKFTSPFTLLNTEDFRQLKPYLIKNNDKINYVETAKNIVNKLKNNPEYKEIVDLFKLYLIDDNIVVYHPDEKWTPSRCQYLGSQHASTRGNYQLNEKYLYVSKPEDWENIVEFKENPQFKITSTVLMAEKNDPTVTIPGKPFVLVSTDLSLNTDSKIIEQFKLQKTNNYNGKNTVKLYWVVEPTASIKEYFENIHKIINRENYDNIGKLLTSFRMWEILLQDQTFVENYTKYNSNKLNTIKTIVENLKDESVSGIVTSLLSKMNDKKLTVSFLEFALHDYIYNVSSIINDDNHSINNDRLQNIINILNEKGLDSVQYNIKYNPNTTINGYHIVSDTKYCLPNTSKSFKINGKIESCIFKYNAGQFVDYILNSLFNKNGHYRSNDNELYLRRRLKNYSEHQQEIQTSNKIIHTDQKFNIYNDGTNIVINLNSTNSPDNYITDKDGNNVNKFTPDVNSIIIFYVKNTNNITKYEFDIKSNDLTIVSEIGITNEIQVNINIETFKEKIRYLLETYSRKPQFLKELLNINSLDDINKIDNLRIPTKFIEKLNDNKQELGDDIYNYLVNLYNSKHNTTEC